MQSISNVFWKVHVFQMQHETVKGTKDTKTTQILASYFINTCSMLLSRAKWEQYIAK